MKKIFLLFMILSLSLMSFVDTHASTHDNFYGYDLDTQYQELGGQSLREFFYDNNMNYQTYINLSTGVTINNEYIYFETTNYATPYIYLHNGTTRHYFSSTNIYYITYSLDVTNDFNIVYFHIANFLATSQGGVKSMLNSIGRTDLYLQLRATQTGNTSATVNMNDLYIIDITSTGLQLSQGRLDFLFHVYKTLYDRELAYDDGYLDGYNDGLIEGYFNGQTDYYNGTYLTQLPGETSTPYNDGQVDGYQFGYNDGYNAGVAEELDTNYLLSFVQGSIAVLGAPILPNITLGVFVFIPLFFGFVGFLFRLGGKRG